MPTVTFLPKNTAIAVANGVSLLDAATAAGVTITAPCGGEGTCGECRVRIEKGALEQALSGCLTPAEAAAGWALACSCRVTGDVTVRVPEVIEESGKIVTEALAGSPGPSTGRPEPLAVKRALVVEAPSLENSFSDLDRLARALRGTAFQAVNEHGQDARATNESGQDARAPRRKKKIEKGKRKK